MHKPSEGPVVMCHPQRKEVYLYGGYHTGDSLGNSLVKLDPLPPSQQKPAAAPFARCPRGVFEDICAMQLGNPEGYDLRIRYKWNDPQEYEEEDGQEDVDDVDNALPTPPVMQVFGHLT